MTLIEFISNRRKDAKDFERQPRSREDLDIPHSPGTYGTTSGLNGACNLFAVRRFFLHDWS